MKIARRKRASSVVPVSSMADIAFLLLIFFMLSTITDMEKEIPVRLPEAEMSETETEKFFNIWIDQSGGIHFDNRQDSTLSLTSYARERLLSNPKTRALIRADRGLPYFHVNRVLDALKDAGLHNIVLVSIKPGGGK